MQAKEYVTALLQSIFNDLGYLWSDKISIEPPKDKQFGDMAANCALVLAKEAKIQPRVLAERFASLLQERSQEIAKIDIAGPGFLNITFTPEFWQKRVVMIEKDPAEYGKATLGQGKKIQVEFVSANPTGPLHIGHGRGAAVGDSMRRILAFAGYEAQAEYYLNDAGNQMHTLGLSIWLRLQEIAGHTTGPFREGLYQGSYIVDIARQLHVEQPDLASKEQQEAINICLDYGLQIIFAGIKQDLADFGVHFDVWFSEKSLVDSGAVAETLESLQTSGHAYVEDGALWFRTTELGDDKDRVLRKSDGSLTYFASDIAYHANKYQRGFDSVIDVWGADHHGYVARMRSAVAALGRSPESFDVILVQLVNLLRNNVPIAMSTRAGQFETLASVIQEVGVDAARFIFLSRKSDSKLDFDLDLVKQRTMDNPVYYVQYAHARIQTVLRRASERGVVIQQNGPLDILTESEELDLLRLMDEFPKIVADAATNHAPHFISYYIMELAGLLHRYYATHQILVQDNQELGAARLRLVHAVGYVLRNGLFLLGVSAPDSM